MPMNAGCPFQVVDGGDEYTLQVKFKLPITRDPEELRWAVYLFVRRFMYNDYLIVDPNALEVSAEFAV